MPVIPKGIMCPEDAILAMKYGADAIYVSNHGCRQLDTTPSTIEVLPEIAKAVRAVNKTIPIWFDGGIRTGEDVFKALPKDQVVHIDIKAGNPKLTVHKVVGLVKLYNR